MAKQIQWINTKEHNPFLAKQYRRPLDPLINDMVVSKLVTSPKDHKGKTIDLTVEETTLFSAEIVSLESTGVPVTFDQLYAQGPSNETVLFWGKQHIEYLDGCYVYISIFAVPEGEVVYHVVPTGKIATIKRIQCKNTLAKDVSISFFIGVDPFQNPRIRSDVLILPTDDYDFSCSMDAFEGESLGMVVSDGNSIRVAISGHLSDVVNP